MAEADAGEAEKSSVNSTKRTPAGIPKGLSLVVKPFGRPRVTWDNCLKEIASTAYNMSQDSIHKVAMSAHLCRKARKEVIKKDNQVKGMKEYRRLVCAHIAYSVKREFSIVMHHKNLVKHTNGAASSHSTQISKNDGKTGQDLESRAKMGDGLKSLIETIILGDSYPEDRADDKKSYESIKTGCLREVHKVLSKWNKPTVKSFLKTPLFETIEKTSELTLTPLDSSMSGQVTNTAGLLAGHQRGEPAQNTQQGSVHRENKREDAKDRAMAKMLKSENVDEVLTLYLNKAKITESFRKVFKSSIDQNTYFPKSFEDVPVVKGFAIEEEETYENRTFFGDFQANQYAESGLTDFIEQTASKVKESGAKLVCSDPATRDSHFEHIVNCLAADKLVVYEQVADKHRNVDCAVMILDPAQRDHFLDDPVVAACCDSPVLLYTLWSLESRFGKKWAWIEQHLRNHPLFRCRRLSHRQVLQLSVYLRLLTGDRLLLNHRQALPAARLANLAFLPADEEPSRKKAAGRRRKREEGREEQEFRSFVGRIEREKGRLAWPAAVDEEAMVGSLFFNRMQFAVLEKSRLGARRFKPSSAAWSGVRGRESKAEPLNDRPPESVPIDEKKPPSNAANYPKYLKKRRLV